MSIRYTLRHNIPSALIDQENAKYEAKQQDVNDSSTFDFNLMRKHELAETDDNRVVYREKEGRIVDWTYEATLQAEQIKNECLTIKDDIDAISDTFQEQINLMIDDAEDQYQRTDALIERVEDMIELDKITDEEIDGIVNPVYTGA